MSKHIYIELNIEEGIEVRQNTFDREVIIIQSVKRGKFSHLVAITKDKVDELIAALQKIKNGSM